MTNGCALSACVAIHLFLEGQDPALLTKKVKTTSQENKIQYNILARVKRLINFANS